MKILRTWKQGDTCQQGVPIIGFPPEGCGCENESTCCEIEGCCVYPSSCGIGPNSIWFYGEIIFGSGTVFGNTQNGLILEDEFWAIYRNGSRTQLECIGVEFPPSINNVSANLASGYALSFVFIRMVDEVPIPEPITSTLEFSGVIPFETEAVGTLGQCFWNGNTDQVTQLFDEGFSLFFNYENCRWELWSGPINELYAYKEGGMPNGTYISTSTDVENIVIA
jgi:hypothetical protein